MKGVDFIYRFVPAGGGSSRTLLLLHGTGGNEDQLVEPGRAIDSDAALLSPRGKILENGAPRFFRRFAEGVFDEADVVARAGELAGFVRQTAVRHAIDTDNLVAVGYSNGANIAAAMMLLGIAPFAQAILLRAMVPLTGVEPAVRKQGRALILAGEFDPIAPVASAEKLAAVLEETGREVEVVVQQGVGHELVENDVVAARQWLGVAS
jgi:phospholipase/carboxylesterase